MAYIKKEIYIRFINNFGDYLRVNNAPVLTFFSVFNRDEMETWKLLF